MTDTAQPYITANPGDLITAGNMNAMQIDIRQDIAKQVADGVAGKHDIEHATSADQLGGMTLDQVTSHILGLALAEVAKRTGHMQVFCNLQLNVDKIIEHKLKAYPIADVYQLDYFLAVCAKDETPTDAQAQWTLFYLYHADERRLRIPPGTDPIDIETDPKFRILWKTLLDQFQEEKLLEYTDDTTLDDLEVDFWRAMFRSPNDSFDPDASCHSPWFEKCCGERRTVGDLKRHGDFDDIYLKIEPQKTINYPTPTQNLPIPDPTNPANEPYKWYQTEPSNIRVSQLDPDTIVLRLLERPTYPPFPTQTGTGKAPGHTTILPLPAGHEQSLPVMLVLKA
jgi:hypothetical protein